VAFLDGPVVLGGLCDEERTLTGDPQTLLVPDNEQEWINWQSGYRARDQQRGLRFYPCTISLMNPTQHISCEEISNE
jgi:hypothetical protein